MAKSMMLMPGHNGAERGEYAADDSDGEIVIQSPTGPYAFRYIDHNISLHSQERLYAQRVELIVRHGDCLLSVLHMDIFPAQTGSERYQMLVDAFWDDQPTDFSTGPMVAYYTDGTRSLSRFGWQAKATPTEPFCRPQDLYTLGELPERINYAATASAFLWRADRVLHHRSTDFSKPILYAVGQELPPAIPLLAF